MLDIVAKRLHAEIGKLPATTGYFTRHFARDVASRLVAASFVASALVDAFGATPYFAVLTFLFRLLQSTFIRGQAIAALSAMTVHFVINNVLIDRARRLLGSLWWRGWATFTVICIASLRAANCVPSQRKGVPHAVHAPLSAAGRTDRLALQRSKRDRFRVGVRRAARTAAEVVRQGQEGTVGPSHADRLEHRPRSREPDAARRSHDLDQRDGDVAETHAQREGPRAPPRAGLEHIPADAR